MNSFRHFCNFEFRVAGEYELKVAELTIGKSARNQQIVLAGPESVLEGVELIHKGLVVDSVLS